MIKHPSCELDPNIYSVALDPVLSSVAVARLMLRAALWDWQLDHLADTAQLIMSELAANAGAPRGALSYPRFSREERKGGSWV